MTRIRRPDRCAQRGAFAAAALAAILLLPSVTAEASGKAGRRVAKAAEVLHQGLSGWSHNIPEQLVHRAKCIGVFPSVRKGAFLIGGRYGKGVVSCRLRDPQKPWSGPATFRIEGGNIGFQAGASASDLIVLFLSPRAVEKLMQSNFTFGAEGEAAAWKYETSAAGRVDALLQADLATFAHSRGLFAGVSVEGATLRPDHDADRKLYGISPRTRDVLRGEVPMTPSAKPFFDMLMRYSPQPRRAD